MRRPWPVPAQPAGTWRGSAPGRIHRPRSVPIEYYQQLEETPLQQANSAVITSAGAARIQIGPQGWGTLWRVSMASVATTTGPTDASDAVVFVGPSGAATEQAAVSLAGGGDSTGLNDALLWPGLYVIAVWSEGTAGATATLVVFGRQRAVIYAPVYTG